MELEKNLDALVNIANYLREVPAPHIAEIFAHSDSEKQAEILHCIAKEFAGFGAGKGCAQNCDITKNLSAIAREWIKNLSEHSQYWDQQ